MIVLDYFADRDCAQQAVACRAVVSRRALRFDARALLAAAATLAPAARTKGLVYGSGFEGRTSLLRRLAARRRLFGNPPEVVEAIKDPAVFFPMLDRLGMAHPETRLTPPSDAAGWLVKRTGGAGGVHVRQAGPGRSWAGRYFQRFQPGVPLSALFLADGQRACVLGFNRQWTTAARAELPYQFGGAVGGIALPRRTAAEIIAGLDRLVAATGLVGLNGVDFLLAHGAWSVLEVNPRPTATFELYDPDYPRGLFDRHLRACEGELPSRLPTPRACRAVAVAHAAQSWSAPPDFSFPRWCRDLPQAESRLAPGDPVCTVHARAADARLAALLARRRIARLARMLAGTTIVARA